jgi:DNA-binding CsgD family transcriptional regulator
MAAKRDILRILEAAYPSEDGEVAWLERLAAAVRTDAGIANDGVFAQLYDASSGTSCDFGVAGGSGVDDAIMHDLFGKRFARYYNEHPELIRAAFLSISFSLSGEIPGVEQHAFLRRELDAAGIGEVVGINASSPSGRGVIVCLLVKKSLRLSEPTRVLFGRVASHIAAANRLRQRLASRGGVRRVETADAIIDEGGRVAHATRGARVPAAREQLASAAVSLLRARRRPRGDQGERAAAAWKALVDARWSLVDHFERDGRRFLVAQRNDPEAPSVDVLTVRERQVAALAALGRANKEIAYELGIATSTVGVLLARAASRLGMRTRRDLVEAFLRRSTSERRDKTSR